MGKILVFLFNGMTDYEITFITHLLHADACKEIVSVSYRNEIIEGNSGLCYKPSRLLCEVTADEVEGLIIPGGWNGEIKPELLKLINDLNQQEKLIGAICGAGTVYLAKAGVLKNVNYTTPVTEWTTRHIQVFGGQDPFPRENYIAARVVSDKNVITAQGSAFIDFATEICSWFHLFGNQEEKEEFLTNIKGPGVR